MKFMTIVAFACVISAGLVAGNQWRETKRIEADLIASNTHEKIDPEHCDPRGHFVYQSGIIDCDLKPEALKSREREWAQGWSNDTHCRVGDLCSAIPLSTDQPAPPPAVGEE